LYAIVFAIDALAQIRLQNVQAHQVQNVSLVGSDAQLKWNAQDDDVIVALPQLSEINRNASTLVLKLRFQNLQPRVFRTKEFG
jgi:hypothetical protein